MDPNLSQSPAPAPLPAQPSSSGQCGKLSGKCRLNVYTQRSRIPFAQYFTVNEGSGHQPQFRCSVTVNGRTYCSPHTFTNLKSAEQHAAKTAMDNLEPEIVPEQMDLSELKSRAHKFGASFKLILNEYAAKRTIPMPSYNTVELDGSIPAFRSSLVFNGVSYTGDTGRSKREAEQLAARATIISLLGNIYPNRKSADQHVAKIAMDNLKSEIPEQMDLSELTSRADKFGASFKLILNEYAAKRTIQIPSYNTVELQGLNPSFRSSLVFHGVSYTGDTGRSKREAEQLAARATILSLDDPESRLIIKAIIQSKLKLCTTSSKVKDTYSTQCDLVPPAVNPPFVAALATVQLPTSIVPVSFVQPMGVSSFSDCPPAKRLCATSSKVKDTCTTQCDLVPPAVNPPFVAALATVQLPTSIVPAGFGQPMGVSSFSDCPPAKKRRKNKKKKSTERV